jgi:replicative DNA helicase
MKIGRKNSPLPRFEDFEKNVLGNCIKNVSLIDKYLISSEDFYEARDQVIFKGILTMKMKGLLTGDLELRQYLKEANLIEKVSGGFLYIGSLTDNAIEHNIGHQVKKLKEASRQRELWKLGHRLLRLSRRVLIKRKSIISPNKFTNLDAETQ